LSHVNPCLFIPFNTVTSTFVFSPRAELRVTAYRWRATA